MPCSSAASRQASYWASLVRALVISVLARVAAYSK
jgi:hypothetical protein